MAVPGIFLVEADICKGCKLFCCLVFTAHDAVGEDTWNEEERGKEAIAIRLAATIPRNIIFAMYDVYAVPFDRQVLFATNVMSES